MSPGILEGTGCDRKKWESAAVPSAALLNPGSGLSLNLIPAGRIPRHPWAVGVPETGSTGCVVCVVGLPL